MITRGMLIKHELEKAGWSEAQIARALKTTKQNVSLVIHSRRGKRPNSLGYKIKKAIAKKLRTTPEELWSATKRSWK